MKATHFFTSRHLRCNVLALLLAWGQAGAAPGDPPPANAGVGVSTNAQPYAVGKKVSEFPNREDLSTPEAAYATLNRAAVGEGWEAFSRLTVKRTREDAKFVREMRGRKGKPVPPKLAAQWAGAEVVEVWRPDATHAAVIARLAGEAGAEMFENRSFELENGKWLNAGQDVAESLEAARQTFHRVRAYQAVEQQRSRRPPVAEPEKRLRPFVEFLRREAAEPLGFVQKSLASHRVVVLGEVHNRPSYWAFNAALVRAPEFVRQVGVIYLELPFNDQPLMDSFLAAPRYDPEPVIAVLRDMFELGWPDQPTLEFCRAVWEVNQAVPKEQRLRIVLVDMARPWKEIQKREDWAKYDVDRDELMAKNILRDLRDHAPDRRHALFIVGWMHTAKNLTQPGGQPLKSAGWHLRQALGDTNVYVVFPHCPVMANRGQVDGRLALGLFETAFAALANRPMAFPLDTGPFGDLLCDASLDFITGDPYRAGFDAFLYLGPLEEEIMSPLIPGFYTDEYAKEVDRRCRLMNGRSPEAATTSGKVTAEGLTKLRSAWWGQPRREWRALGPLNAWHYGSDWEKLSRNAKHRDAMQDAPAIRREAQRLFDALRKADYQNPGDWQSFPAPDVDYTVNTDYPAWMQWVCRHFLTNSIVNVDLGEVFLGSNRLPALNYKLTLKDGSALKGTLPFRWDARTQRWGGWEGLDWHLRPAPQAKAAQPASAVRLP